MSLLYALIVLAVFSPGPSRAHEPAGVCALDYCTCTPAAHPSWTTVNCTVPPDQSMDIFEGDLPESTTDITITGAQALMFGPNSLTHLKDVRHLRVADVRILLMRKAAAVQLNVVSIYLEIEKCPLSVNITDCDTVSMEGATFSWLLSLSICNVAHMEFSREAFLLDQTAANVGEHGPGLMIYLKNLTTAEFPQHAFGSSAASIILIDVEVGVIRSKAFTANTYNVVEAVNCSIALIEEGAFAHTTLVNNLEFTECKINQIMTDAIQSAVSNLNISHCIIKHVETGGINTTVAAVAIQDNEFHNFMQKGFELSHWSKFIMERNLFNDLPSNAIIAPGTSIHELIFAENEIETANPESLAFIGQAFASSPYQVKYTRNYFGQPCHCNVTTWLTNVLGADNSEEFQKESYCTVDEFFARCFNSPDQSMVLDKFLNGVCGEQSTIQCEAFKNKTGIVPRFPHHKDEDEGGLTSRNAKVIGIMIVTCVGCVIVALLISLIKWMRRRGYCINLKNLILSSSSCCDRACGYGRNDGVDNARSISQLSVHEYSERHRLNEPRLQDAIQETTLPDMYTEQVVPVDDKTTQTLPEELTKELLDNLKEKLDDPENYVEAREMIEHLYELIKVEEMCNSNSPISRPAEENIYELPFQNTAPRLGKNKKQMISVGTRTPSIDKLTPLSPYHRQTALAHEYFEPKDFAMHLYAEIANSDKERKNLMNAMPDVVAEQAIPRGPYLRAVRDKIGSNISSPASKSMLNSPASPSSVSTIKSNKSTLSNSSGKMMNRPLPEKPPALLDPGEGTSYKHG
ncbi:hypothetical protein NE865_10289 [Phthorimaea operculella]|nr:hypothetical protein NE865_10289 [Phthorimaea operculella]